MCFFFLSLFHKYKYIYFFIKKKNRNGGATFVQWHFNGLMIFIVLFFFLQTYLFLLLFFIQNEISIIVRMMRMYFFLPFCCLFVYECIEWFNKCFVWLLSQYCIAFSSNACARRILNEITQNLYKFYLLVKVVCRLPSSSFFWFA